MSDKKNTYSPVSIAKESYKTIRTNLIYTLAGADERLVAITSTTPSEGKSTTAANLVVSIAQTNTSVLAIDADMRRPSLSKLFKVPNTYGLSQILSKQAVFEEVVKSEVKPNLSLLSSGPIPPNPSELLASPEMKELLAKVSQKYDYVIIDTPPVSLFSDSQIISGIVAGVIIVAKYKAIQYKDLNKTAEEIKSVGGKVLGVIVNGVNGYSKSKSRKYYKSYGSDDDID